MSAETANAPTTADNAVPVEQPAVLETEQKESKPDLPQQSAAEPEGDKKTEKKAQSDLPFYLETPPADDPKTKELIDNGVTNLKMSRGMRPEADVNFDKLRTMFVFDELGNKIRFTDTFKMQKTIIIFTRVRKL
jgi:hypothetical protein